MVLNLTDMTSEELYELIADAQTELGRRQTAGIFEQKIGALLDEGQAAGVIVEHQDGEEWQPVTGYHNVYRKNAVVTHNGKTWTSNIDFNAGEPGVSGWTEQVEEGEYLVWSQPQGYEDAYAPGVIVWHPNKGDQLYKNTHTAGNTWEPGTPHSQWEPYTPDGDES